LSRFGFDSARIEDIYGRGAARVREVPGVISVAVAAGTFPMGNASASGFSVPGAKRVRFERGGPYQAAVTTDFFATIGARIIKGRNFTAEEERSGGRVVIVNDVIAKGYWPNENPIGKCVMYGDDKTCSTVVGVVGTVLQFSLINDERAIAYVVPRHPGNDAPPAAMLVRVEGPPEAIVPLVRRELQALDAAMPFVNVKAYSELVAPQLQPWRLGATMFTVFGIIAVLIAAVGLYSVTAYWVSQRTHEIGVRMALGAQRGDVVRLVAMQSARATVAGLLLGGIVALVASRWITDMLYETSPYNPAVYGWAAAVLAIAAVVASVVPARRSTAVDPAMAIKTE
jgi:predicted permease